MAFMNASGTIGIILSMGTATWTGSWIMTFFFILGVMLMFGILLKIPFDVLFAILLIPILAIASAYSYFITILVFAIFILIWITVRLLMNQ